MNCPKCNSPKTIKCGFKLLANAQRKQRWQCQNCGRYFESNIVEPRSPAKLENLFYS